MLNDEMAGLSQLCHFFWIIRFRVKSFYHEGHEEHEVKKKLISMRL